MRFLYKKKIIYIYNFYVKNHSEIFLNEISIKFCFMDILTKPKAYITRSSVILTYS